MSRLASAWLESPGVVPPRQSDSEFDSLIRFILHENKLHRQIHPRLQPVSSFCQVCRVDFDYIWRVSSKIIYLLLLNEKCKRSNWAVIYAFVHVSYGEIKLILKLFLLFNKAAI